MWVTNGLSLYNDIGVYAVFCYVPLVSSFRNLIMVLMIND
jgi:hypothetical protein